jgi:hypothetical protein
MRAHCIPINDDEFQPTWRGFLTHVDPARTDAVDVAAIRQAATLKD